MRIARPRRVAIKRIDCDQFFLTNRVICPIRRTCTPPAGYRHRSAVGHGKRRQPEAGLESRGVYAIGQPAVAIGELRVCIPITRGALIAVVELHVPKKATVEVRRGEVEIRDHVRLSDIGAELRAAGPACRRRERREPLAIHGRRGCRGRGECREAVRAGAIGDVQRRRVAL